MRKFLFFCAVLAAVVLWGRDFISSGKFDRWLERNPGERWSAAVEYYGGVLAGLAQRPQAAEYRFTRVLEKHRYPEYRPLAWSELLELWFDRNDREKVLAESDRFLQKYPDHPKAEIVRRRVQFILNG